MSNLTKEFNIVFWEEFDEVDNKVYKYFDSKEEEKLYYKRRNFFKRNKEKLLGKKLHPTLKDRREIPSYYYIKRFCY